MKPIIYLGLCTVFGAIMNAQTESFWGMNKDEIVQGYAPQITLQSPSGLTLRTKYFGRDAEVYLGLIRDGKVGFVEVSFTSFNQDIPERERLTLFKEIRNQLEAYLGHRYSYARIDGVDVLGESGGWVPDKKRNNEFVFGTVSNGLVYQVEIFGESLNDLVKSGDVRLTINKEESLQSPKSK